ncbi:hypothetical protein BDR03DRAFT_964604 [Suillus americanus]|nr:hypothetical protein BDR03DRAFT_964604 [Suillus americanus]
MSYYRSLNSGLYLRRISTAAYLWCVPCSPPDDVMPDQHILNSHLCDGLPVIFNFSSDFYRSNIRGAFCVSVCFYPTVAVLFATS